MAGGPPRPQEQLLGDREDRMFENQENLCRVEC